MSSSPSTSASSSGSTAARDGGSVHDVPTVRRLDWRFLLPSTEPPPYRLVLLGADATLLAEARGAGLARTVLGELPPTGTVDAIAVLHRARSRVAEVASRLAPGGLLYWEVDRLQQPTRSPSVLRSSLGRHGVLVQDVYWVGPHFRRPSAWVSLSADRALAWYARSMFVPRTWARSLGVRALGSLTGWRADRLEHAAPRYAVVAGRHPPARPAPTLFQLGQDAKRSSEATHAVMLTGGEGDWSRVTLLPFDAEGWEPERVLKAARRPAFASSVEREQTALAEVRARLGAGLRDTVPEPLGTHLWNGAVVGVETFVGGRSMGISLADRGAGWEQKRRDLRDAAGWLAAMHVRTLAARDPWNRVSRMEILHAPLDRYASLFGLGEGEARLFEATLRASEDLDGNPFPKVRWHRDFQPTNVFRDGDTIRVIDWEVSTVGPALIDLIYFLLHWGWRACGARSESARQAVFRELFVARKGRAARAAGEEIARYRERLGIDARYVPIFVLLTMVQLALDRADRLRSLDGPHRDGRGAHPHTAYVGLLAEDR